MLHFLPPRELKKRADAIRLGLGALAKAAGIDETNLYRAVRNDVAMRSDNAHALTEALVAEERALFEHLLGLHPEWRAEPRETPPGPAAPDHPPRKGEGEALGAAA